MATAIIDGLATRYEVMGSGPPLLMYAPAGFDATLDLADVRGQDSCKRALEIAAAGGHSALLVGPPGAGKTMLARRIPGLLPPPTFEEAVEATSVWSVAGRLGARQGLLTQRPFRAPHHTISVAGLVGGGSPPRPGEVSLAHNGLLFLDELPEFGRAALEALRQPLEDGEVAVVRARGAALLPSRFMLIAAMNPCPCGHEGDPRCQCGRDPDQERGVSSPEGFRHLRFQRLAPALQTEGAGVGAVRVDWAAGESPGFREFGDGQNAHRLGPRTGGMPAGISRAVHDCGGAGA